MSGGTVWAALWSVAHEMPGAVPAQLVRPVTRAWNGHHLGARTIDNAQNAVVGTTWSKGYWTGAYLAHQRVTQLAEEQAMNALSTIARSGGTNPGGVRLLWAVAAAATAVAADGVSIDDPGPSRDDYRRARAEHVQPSLAGKIAAGAKVGWNRGHAAGVDDATWSATTAIVAAVEERIGPTAINNTTINGEPARAWLTRIGRPVSAGRTAAHRPAGRAFPTSPRVAVPATPPIRVLAGVAVLGIQPASRARAWR